MPKPTKQSIFLIHHGNQEYLKIAAQMTQSAGNEVILIGSDSGTGNKCDAYYDDSLIEIPDYVEFERHYVHMSSATAKFELLCFKRYFYLHAVAKQRGLSHFWMIDSDAVVLKNLSDITENFLLKNNYISAVSTEYQKHMHWASSPHTSFWTLAGLEDFIEFLKKMYQGDIRKLLDQKYEYHLANQIPGGICDMTALFLWQRDKSNVFNSAKAYLEGLPLFDNNLNQTGNAFENEFQMVRNIKLKKVTFEEGMHWAHLAKDQSKIPVAAVHFQGTAKPCMATFQQKLQITYFSFAGYAFKQYIEKRKNSLLRKTRKLISKDS